MFPLAACAQAPSQPADTYLQAPWDTTATQVPPQTEGMDCSRIAAGIKARRPEAPLYGSIRADSLLAFASKDSVDVSYNPARGIAKVSADMVGGMNPLTQRAGHAVRLLVGQIRSHTSTKKPGPNGKSIESIREDLCMVAITGLSDDKAIAAVSDVAIPMTPQQADAVLPHMKTLYVGTLEPPSVAPHARFYAASAGNPAELRETGDALLLRLRQVLFFEPATGKVWGGATLDGAR